MAESPTVQRVDRVLLVTIDRPHRRNAIDQPTAEGIAAAMELLDGDPRLCAGVLTGAGGWFSAGMDLAEFAAGRPCRVPGRGFAGLAERPPAKPLLAAVEGGAWGGGLELLLCCDLVVAARDARFALPEVRRGLLPAAGGLLRLSSRVPHQIAMEMLLTGDPLDAARAERYGLVNTVCEPGESRALALRMSHRIAEAAPLAVRAAKRIGTLARDWPAAEGFERQRALVDEVRRSRDAREGARAFLERRTPEWSGT
ncbi:crotonase/enoyl-CoA hydratase family protein [Streptomyces sp. TRM 70361]|uniref:crotonase/enoyl-CoA hydratase family protein n=1 Tax=Streptomyces sp. TRM 70361 TaxID=3116553 RepID=UPI002E7B33F5|nr:crotonase/enoyl-CoA hydratase family protein [Streptomyces sp. TRM 70361]MEE1942779.1 crotonase/enoyl-CoA hydratase family protein [Streptomyces sp. TRM 70361]